MPDAQSIAARLLEDDEEYRADSDPPFKPAEEDFDSQDAKDYMLAPVRFKNGDRVRVFPVTKNKLPFYGTIGWVSDGVHAVYLFDRYRYSYPGERGYVVHASPGSGGAWWSERALRPVKATSL